MPSPYPAVPAHRERIPRSQSSDGIAPAARGQRTNRSFSTGTSWETYEPSVPLASNEILVYYDSAWSTSEVRFPPVRQRPGVFYQSAATCRPAAGGAGAEPVLVSLVSSPSKKRHLVKAVGKAKGFVKVVARRSIRRLRKKGEPGQGLVQSISAPSLSGPTPDDWTERFPPSGITIVVESETDTPGDSEKQPSQSKFSVTTADCADLPVSPRRPQNSMLTIETEAQTPPHIDEEVAFELLNVLYYGNPTNDDDNETGGDAIEDAAPQSVLGANKGASSPAGAQTEGGSLMENVLHIVFFVPWCVAVGGAILLAPTTVDAITFGGGFLAGPPPRGLHRFAYWATNAHEHVFIFLACLAVLQIYYGGALWACAFMAVRVAWVWAGFRPRANLHLRVGEDDMESLWLIWKGKAVSDAMLAKEGERVQDSEFDDAPVYRGCMTVCVCHGVCPSRCPDLSLRTGFA